MVKCNLRNIFFFFFATFRSVYRVYGGKIDQIINNCTLNRIKLIHIQRAIAKETFYIRDLQQFFVNVV